MIGDLVETVSAVVKLEKFQRRGKVTGTWMAIKNLSAEIAYW